MTDIQSQMEKTMQGLSPSEQKAFQANIDRRLSGAIQQAGVDARTQTKNQQQNNLLGRYFERLENVGTATDRKKLQQSFVSQGMETNIDWGRAQQDWKDGAGGFVPDNSEDE